jgi:hypothetical protein
VAGYIGEIDDGEEVALDWEAFVYARDGTEPGSLGDGTEPCASSTTDRTEPRGRGYMNITASCDLPAGALYMRTGTEACERRGLADVPELPTARATGRTVPDASV